MALAVKMPKLGLTMTEGQLAAWLVEEGATVTKGQMLAEIETEKIVVQVESPGDGIVARFLVEPGAVVPVGQDIAWLVAPGEAVPEIGGATEAPPVVPVAAPAPAAPAPSAPAAAPAGKARLTPYARRLAQELRVDLSTVMGSGPNGSITGDDIQAAARRRKEAAPAATPLAGTRKVIAERMAESHATAARVTLFSEVDATHLVAWRERLRSAGSAPSFNDLLIQLCARALREMPLINRSLTAEGIVQRTEVNVGLAVDTERGLIVPVIHDADRKTLTEITQDVAGLVDRARANTLTTEDIRGGTFTITNLGMYGVDGFTPIINLPECAILGVGRIVDAPAVRDGQLCIRKRMILSLAFDHRLVDGGPAAQFLQGIARLIESPPVD
jgi:pyruvate dehydrogenase E2 component (dihydrolipoamide acetyltransferase)